MKANQATYPVRVMGRLLGVSASGFYAWAGRPPSARAVEDIGLTALIHAIHRRSDGAYGAPSIHAELADDHHRRVGKKRVARLMRAARLQGLRPRRFVTTTIGDPTADQALDQVDREFTPGPTRPSVRETPAGRVFWCSASWTPSTTRVRCPRKRVRPKVPLAQQSPDDIKAAMSRREFVMPIFNRGTRLRFNFLVSVQPDRLPLLNAACDHLGVRMYQRPAKQMLLGVVRDHAAWAGLLVGLALAIVIGVWIDTVWLAALLAFLLGSFSLLLGVPLVKYWQWLTRAIG